jgi:hypothetical protein
MRYNIKLKLSSKTMQMRKNNFSEVPLEWISIKIMRELEKIFCMKIIETKSSPDDQGCDLDWFLFLAFRVEWAKIFKMSFSYFYGGDVTLLKPTNHQR